MFPHDRIAFTEGLFYQDGFLYEGTGGDNGTSSIRKVKLETGEVVQSTAVPEYFGEGIIRWKDKLYQLTYQTQVGFIYEFATLKKQGEFHYPGEGWSFTTDGKQLYFDNGSSQIYTWDPETLQQTGQINVTDDGKPVDKLNEMEWVKGEIFANIWTTNKIARIDPKTGKVTGWVDLTGLLTPADRIPAGPMQTDVLNGIAYDAEHDRLFVTGKRWPKLFEIKLVKQEAR
ncbi:MAG: glutaminyl-peptide cyclotransferase [Candidatus Solibacter sp.]|nr:glutaminyl-peptide cyclotransferase [Candidatus Solibacter sp.]